MDKNAQIKEVQTPCCVCGHPSVVIGRGSRALCGKHSRQPVETPNQDGIEKAASVMRGEK